MEHECSFSFFMFFLMIRRPPRSTQSRSSAASDVYKRQVDDSFQASAPALNYVARIFSGTVSSSLIFSICALLFANIYSFEKSGVLLDTDDDTTVIPEINPSYYLQLKSKSKIFAGMIPKLDNAFAALKSGVGKVIIGKAENLKELINGSSGTTITNE